MLIPDQKQDVCFKEPHHLFNPWRLLRTFKVILFMQILLCRSWDHSDDASAHTLMGSCRAFKPFCSYFAVMWSFTLPPGPADVHFSLKVFFFFTFTAFLTGSTLLSFYSLPLLCRHASALFEILNQFLRDARVGRSQGTYQLWYVTISWHLMTILPDLQITFSKLTLNSYFK